MLSFTFPALGLNPVKLAYRCLIDHILPVILIPIVAITAACLLHPSLIKLLLSFFTCLFIFIVYFISKPNTIYLVDYICYNPPKALRSPFSFFMESSNIYLKNNPKSVEFQMRILERSGLSEETCVAPGNDRSMLLPNCLFRLGGAAIFLSNKRHEHHYAKYKLINIVRTHTGSHEESYKSIHQIEDHEGKLGVRLSKNLSVIAGRALKTNIMKIGPAVWKHFFIFIVVRVKLLRVERKDEERGQGLANSTWKWVQV
nr:3-ketoacyl-CoA synthase 6 [Tanacetum cinerariifolium]